MTPAVIIAACACAANARRKNLASEPMHFYHEKRKVERPIIGMVKVLNDRDIAVIDDLQNDGVELRFRSVMAVDDLIRKLQRLKDDMMTLKGE